MSANGNEVAVESNGKVEEQAAGDVKTVSPAKRKLEEEPKAVAAEKKAKTGEVANGNVTGDAGDEVEGLDEVEDLDDEDEDVDEEDEEEEDEDEEGGEEDEEEGGDEEEEG